MILGLDNRKAWSKMDVLVMQAYEIFKSEQCQSCGQPIWICRNDDPRLQARKKIVQCWVSAEVDGWREKMAEGDDSDKRDARFVRADVYSRDDRELSEYRLPYYEALQAEAEEDGS